MCRNLLPPENASTTDTPSRRELLHLPWETGSDEPRIGYRHKDNNTAERALRNSVIGRKNFYGSGARWAADLAADVWTITATAAQTGLEPLLPWTPQGRARPAVPAGTRHGPGP